MAKQPNIKIQPPKNGERSAAHRWTVLDGLRNGFLRRLERYASVTVPKVCLPDDISQDSEAIQYDWSSVGAQAVNHLTNKLGMTLFSPSRPFFRLDPDKSLLAELAKANITEAVLREALVGGESEAIKLLDRKALRPKLYDLLRHLIVTGNALLDTSEADTVRVMGIKTFCVKRSVSGQLQELLIRECVLYDELDEGVKAMVPGHKPEDKVNLYKWCRRQNDMWTCETYVDHILIGGKYSGTFKPEDFPYHVQTWDLCDAHDYGTGLVELFSGDFNALSVMSEAEIRSAVLASEFRWLADPAGITDVNDFKKSSNGDVLPGRKDDLTLVHMTSTNALQEIANSSDKIIRRLGAAFLLGSATTRDAERVTAEELRMQAQELESSLGGVYSMLAVSLQVPLAGWLLRQTGVEVNGTKLLPTVITGLDALSRNADAQNLVLALQDLGAIATLPPAVQARLKIEEVISTLLSARGIQPSKYLKPEAQVAQEAQAAAKAAQEQNAQAVAVEQGAKAAAATAQQGPPQQ